VGEHAHGFDQLVQGLLGESVGVQKDRAKSADVPHHIFEIVMPIEDNRPGGAPAGHRKHLFQPKL
jgi:hypothetical protein